MLVMVWFTFSLNDFKDVFVSSRLLLAVPKLFAPSDTLSLSPGMLPFASATAWESSEFPAMNVSIFYCNRSDFHSDFPVILKISKLIVLFHLFGNMICLLKYIACKYFYELLIDALL